MLLSIWNVIYSLCSNVIFCISKTPVYCCVNWPFIVWSLVNWTFSNVPNSIQPDSSVAGVNVLPEIIWRCLIYLKVIVAVFDVLFIALPCNNPVILIQMNLF